MTPAAHDAFRHLAILARWVAWKTVRRGDKATKAPFETPDKMADTTNPATWGTREQATACHHGLSNGLDDPTRAGIGIVLGELQGRIAPTGIVLAGIDLDSCVLPDGGLAPWAQRVMAACSSYTETSPSGGGVKIFFTTPLSAARLCLDQLRVEKQQWGAKRSIPGTVQAGGHGPGVEIYFSARFFAVTYQHRPETPYVIGFLDPASTLRLAEVIIAITAAASGDGEAAPRLGSRKQRRAAIRDDSRSGRAWRTAGRMPEGTSYDDMVAAFAGTEDPGVRLWTTEQLAAGSAGERQFRRCYEHIGADERAARAAFEARIPPPNADDRQASGAKGLPNGEDKGASTGPGNAPGTGAPPPGEGDDHGTTTDWASPFDEERWPEIDAEAFHGLAGDIVDAIDPLTEADPAALLAQLLVMTGNALGPEAYCRVGHTKHYANLYSVICGDTAKARKGTSFDPIWELFRETTEDWAEHCVKSGLSSGEGIIHAVHDDIYATERVYHGKDSAPTYEQVLKEEGVEDKRLLLVEAEFASPLSIMQRSGNTLSGVLRLGWDGKKLQTLTKQQPETATGAHFSLIGHITIEELRVRLDQVSMANGFGNRILFVLARRSKELPFPGWLADATRDKFASKLSEILNNTVLRREITFRPEARDLWIAEYHELSAAKPGLFGFLVARAEAQVLRLSMIYALLDGTHYIEPAHLRAGLAFWRYCEASAKYIFGDALGDPIADEILRALRRLAPDGMTRSEISNLFGRNQSSERIG